MLAVPADYEGLQRLPSPTELMGKILLKVYLRTLRLR